MTVTQEMKDEWVVYRLADGQVRCVPRERWNRVNPEILKDTGVVLLAESLNETQAAQFVALTREET